MTSTTAQPAATPARRLIIAGATGAAAIATGAAYFAMVGFGRDVVGMTAVSAYLFAGVLEICLVTVALMAREAAQQQRPNGLLLWLTWGFSGASAIFAAAHEIALDHSAVAAGFRFIVPFLAALMWHLVLVGDRHLATGRSWSQIRAGARMAAMFRATRRAERAHHRHQLLNTKRTLKELERAQARQDRAEDRVLDTVPPADVRAAVTEWRAAVVDVSDATTDIRLHESRRLLALQAPREIAGEPVAINPAPAADVLQELTAPAPQVSGDLTTAVEAPAEPQRHVSPVAASQEPTEADTAPSEPVQPSGRPHLVTVPNTPAEEEVTEQRAPEPEPPAKRSDDTSSTAELALEAARLRADGHKVKEIARRLSATAGRPVSERTVYRWTKAS